MSMDPIDSRRARESILVFDNATRNSFQNFQFKTLLEYLAGLILPQSPKF